MVCVIEVMEAGAPERRPGSQRMPESKSPGVAQASSAFSFFRRMTSLPSLSVVIPCFNAGRWIAATLESVYAQAWPNLEVIVVDDGSSDNSVASVEQQFPLVRVLRQPNSGVAAARNLGLAAAQGDWIAFVDADDIWLPGKLAAQWDALRSEAGVRMACSGWHVWESQEPRPSSGLLEQLAREATDPSRWGGPSGWIYAQLLLDCQVWTSTVFAQRSLFDQIGNFDSTLRIGEDLDLWLRASRVTPIIRVAKPLALYRMHPASITKGAPKENYQAMVVTRAVQRWGYKSPNGPAARKADVDRAIAATWRDFAGAQFVAGDYPRARSGAWQSLRTDWRQLGGWLLLARSAARTLAAGANKR